MTERPGQEPTEPATPKRERQAWEQGQIPYSRKLSPTLHFFTFCVFFAVLVEASALALARFAARCFQLQPAWDKALPEAAGVFWRVSWPFLALGFVVALFSGLAQSGVRFNWLRLRPKLENLSWRRGLRNVFSRRALVDLGWSLPFLIVFFGLVPGLVWWHRDEVFALAQGPLSGSLKGAGDLLVRLLWMQFGLILTFGALDLALSIRRHRRQLMMTRKEVEDEYRREEGDPRLKSERRSIFERWLHQNPERRIMEEAKVLIVNPEHLAVAVGIDETRSPVILARGEGAGAARFKELARKAGVPIVRDARLARALHRLQEDQDIPLELLEALAVVFVTLGLDDG
jgi:flagellar biosynthetic protein FlhB